MAKMYFIHATALTVTILVHSSLLADRTEVTAGSTISPGYFATATRVLQWWCDDPMMMVAALQYTAA